MVDDDLTKQDTAAKVQTKLFQNIPVSVQLYNYTKHEHKPGQCIQHSAKLSIDDV